MMSNYDGKGYTSHGNVWPGQFLPRTRMRDEMVSERDVKAKKSSPKNKPFTAVIAVVLAFLISLTMVAIAVAVTVVVLRSETTSAQDTTDTYSMSLTLSSNYDAELADSSSLKFHVLAETTCNRLEQIYRRSVLQKSYLGCIINSFSQGSVIATGMLLFDNQADITTKQKPAGNSLTPEEYTVLEILNAGAQTDIPDYMANSATVTAVDTPSDVSSVLNKVDMIERNRNCDDQPCLNGGTCTDGLDKFFCECTSAYTGSTCAADVTECTSSACSENGECLELVGGGVRCICDAGYTSVNCQININDCSDSPCGYGNCTDLVGNFSCTCKPGYTGYRCDVEIDPAINCDNHPPCGDATITRGSVVASYVEGESVQYTCASGYRIVGSNDNTNNSASVFCERDGTWTTTPTCEPVVCGVPLNGTNTQPVVTSPLEYLGTYTYSCMPDYEAAGSLQTTCQPDGSWSLDPPPNCTAIVCSGSLLQDLTNATFTRADVLVGDTVVYTCDTEYKLAPSVSASNQTTVTCQSDGTFSTLLHSCVYIYPSDCRDYYTRDNLFFAGVIACTLVTTDPDGPSNAFTPADVQCCKVSSSEFCTSIAPSSGISYFTPVDPCNGAGPSAVLPNTEFAGTLSKLCHVPTDVTYDVGQDNIEGIIANSAGGCTQVANINCRASADSLSLALRVNGEPSGFLYGTSIFQGASPLMNISNYAYTNAVCDCGIGTSPVDTSTSGACSSGCSCTTAGPVGGNTADTITKYLTADSPSYITSYQITQHDTPSGLAVNDVVLQLGAIQCCEMY